MMLRRWWGIQPGTLAEVERVDQKRPAPGEKATTVSGCRYQDRRRKNCTSWFVAEPAALAAEPNFETTDVPR